MDGNTLGIHGRGRAPAVRSRIPVGKASAVIHPSAVVHPRAEVGPGCQIGPYCVIGEHVTLGRECKLHSHIVIDG
ncbi:MAG TPA: hypothetical protein VN281_03355, partial [Verrucomicrobiae bacterium]|nr:hypothetical protein [Verrucomicrobiae bacterium]